MTESKSTCFQKLFSDSLRTDYTGAHICMKYRDIHPSSYPFATITGVYLQCTYREGDAQVTSPSHGTLTHQSLSCSHLGTDLESPLGQNMPVFWLAEATKAPRENPHTAVKNRHIQTEKTSAWLRKTLSCCKSTVLTTQSWHFYGRINKTKRNKKDRSTGS